MRYKKLSIFSPEYKRIKEIYDISFPKEEQFPFLLLRLQTIRKNTNFLAFHNDNDEFCGFVYAINTKNYVFIFYFAINPIMRFKGYGSKILSEMKNIYTDKVIVLNIEEVSEKFDNYTQRKKRLDFYEKNGYVDSEYLVSDGKQYFNVLILKDNVLDFEEYVNMFKYFSFGRITPEIFNKNKEKVN